MSAKTGAKTDEDLSFWAQDQGGMLCCACLSVPHPLCKHLHEEVIQAIISEPASYHDLWAVEQLLVVAGGQRVHQVVRVMQVHLREEGAGYFLIETLGHKDTHYLIIYLQLFSTVHYH